MLPAYVKRPLTRTLLYLLCLLLCACAANPPAALIPEPKPVVALNQIDGRVATVNLTADGQGRVVVSAADGSLLFERALPVEITALCWTSRGELLAFGYRLRRYSFGGNLTQTLYQLTAGATEAIPLTDLTIKPGTASRFAGEFASLLQVAFAPMGDELVFASLHDPPDAPAYLELVHRNWQSARQRELVRLPIAPVQLAWSQDDVLLVRSAAEADSQLALWETPLTLRSVSENPRLPSERPAAYDEILWTLRRWRAQGLITPEDYLHLLEKESP